MEKHLEESYKILDQLRLPHGLYLASPSKHYSYVWIRDSFYISLPYLNKKCDTYERAFYRIFDILKEYEWKLDIHTKQKPQAQYEHLHIRYSANYLKELPVEWGHAQNDCWGCFLWGIGEGIKHGKKMIRDSHDLKILQKLIWYLNTLEYWEHEDSGMWEEWREKRASSIGACVAGLENVSRIVEVPIEMISKGYKSLYELFPRESNDKSVDSALLSLVYPYNIFPKSLSKTIIENIEGELLRSNGCIRYHSDSYFSTLEEEYGRDKPREFYVGFEPEWTMFLPWLAICNLQIGNARKANEYIRWTEDIMLEDSSLPELYYSGTNKPNENRPLGWSNALYIVAKEMLN